VSFIQCLIRRHGIEYKTPEYPEHFAEGYYNFNNDYEHVYDIKSTNMLGRKDFASGGIISTEIIQGEGFNYTPSELDKNKQYAKSNWLIIEYENVYDDDEDENENIIHADRPLQNNLENNINNTRQIVKLARPKFAKLTVQNNSNSTEITNSNNQEQNYYIFYSNDLLTIHQLDILGSDIENTTIFGPFKTKNDVTNFIFNWKTINNYNLIPVNSNTLKIVSTIL